MTPQPGKDLDTTVGADPRARWRTMPDRIRPDRWETAQETPVVARSLTDAEDRCRYPERTYGG